MHCRSSPYTPIILQGNFFVCRRKTFKMSLYLFSATIQKVSVNQNFINMIARKPEIQRKQTRSEKYVSKGKHALAHHNYMKLIVYIRVHSQCCIFYGFEQIYNDIQFSSVTQSCPTLCNHMDCSMPGLPVHHQLPELALTHVCQVGDAIQPSHPLSSPSPALSLPQLRGLLK